MLSNEMQVCVVGKSSDETEMFVRLVSSLGFPKTTGFADMEEACKNALKVQYQLFVLRNENPAMTGIAFVQRLRDSMNYGNEKYLFCTERCDEAMLTFLHEFDIEYIVAPPFTGEKFSQKISFISRTEAALSPAEKAYREAKMLSQHGMLDEAREQAIQGIRTHGPNEKLLILLGEIETRRGDLENAKKILEMAQKGSPNSPHIIRKLGNVYLQEKNFFKASELFNSVAKLNPHNIELLVNAGLSNLEVGQVDAARTQLSAAYSIDQGSKKAVSGMAQMHLKDGKHEEASKLVMDKLDNKELVQFLNNAGVKLSKDNDVAGALKMYQMCIERVKDNELVYAIYYNMGLCYFKLNDKKSAIQYYQLSIDMKPDFLKAQNALKNLLNAVA